MTTIKEGVSKQAGQLKQDVLRRQRDDDISDDNEITNESIKDSKLRNNPDVDEDDQNLSDDDIDGFDIDTDDKDEWDSDKVNDKDLDQDDFDDENIDADELQRDKGIGGIGYISSNTAPEPEEIPEEHGTDNEEVVYREQEELEKANDNERPNTEQTEVSPLHETEAPIRPAPLR